MKLEPISKIGEHSNYKTITYIKISERRRVKAILNEKPEFTR